MNKLKHLNAQNLICSLLTAGCVFAAGCDMNSHEPVASDEKVAVSSDAALLLLGSAANGHLERIADGFRVIDSADLGLTDSSISAEDARQLVPQLSGIGLSLSQASDKDLAAWKPLTDAALDAGLPVIIEEVKDPDRVANIVGIAVDAELLMVTSLGPNRHRVNVYGDNSVVNAHIESSEQPGVLSPSFSEDIEFAVDAIAAEIDNHEPSFSTKATPATGYRYYEVNFSTYNWSLTPSQTASLNLDFEIELVRDAQRGKKNVFIRPIGTGQHPGSLTWDGSSKRGYYQESQEITLKADGSSHAATLYAHAPATPNSETNYTSTTGWTIGVSGENPVLSYSQDDAVRTTMSDFSAVNQSSGNNASWQFRMTSEWQDMFHHPVFQKCKVKSLPLLSKSNLKPEFEAVFRADINYTKTSPYRISNKTVMRMLERGGNAFKCNMYTTWKTIERSYNIYIHYGSI